MNLRSLSANLLYTTLIFFFLIIGVSAQSQYSITQKRIEHLTTKHSKPLDEAILLAFVYNQLIQQWETRKATSSDSLDVFPTSSPRFLMLNDLPMNPDLYKHVSPLVKNSVNYSNKRVKIIKDSMFVDRNTKIPATLLRVSARKWVSKNKVIVIASYQRGMKWGGEMKMEMLNSKGKWAVIKSEETAQY